MNSKAINTSSESRCNANSTGNNAKRGNDIVREIIEVDRKNK